MKVFISWSGNRSKHLATALKLWLPDVFQDIETWMSDHDINAGNRWNNDLADQLESSNFGVICLTPENVNAPWILFEAGSLAKTVKVARVIPYRLGLAATDVGFPLAQFQGVDASEEGTLKLIESINETREASLPRERLQRLFNKWWPDLYKHIEGIPKSQDAPTHQRTDRELLEEILQLVRPQQVRQSASNEVNLVRWGEEIPLDRVSAEDIADIDDSYLQHFYYQVQARFIATTNRDEERMLDEKMRLAQSELSRRGYKIVRGRIKRSEDSSAPA